MNLRTQGKSRPWKTELLHKEGEIVAVVGHSGCSKSNLLNVVAGFYPPQRGRWFSKTFQPRPSSYLCRLSGSWPCFPSKPFERISFGLEEQGIPQDRRRMLPRIISSSWWIKKNLEIGILISCPRRGREAETAILPGPAQVTENSSHGQSAFSTWIRPDSNGCTNRASPASASKPTEPPVKYPLYPGAVFLRLIRVATMMGGRRRRNWECCCH